MEEQSFKKIPQELFSRILSNTITPKEIEDYVGKHPNYTEYINEALRLRQTIQAQATRSIDTEDAWSKVHDAIGATEPARLSLSIRPAYYLAAACTLLFGVAFSLFLLSKGEEKPLASNDACKTIPAAYLELSDGRTIDLLAHDNASVEDGGVQISLSGNGIAYDKKQEDKKVDVVYNTLVVPNSGEYTLKLSDGTTIYVNSGSELVFPVQLPENADRKIKLKGEAYFEVTKRGASSKFIVETDKGTIEVLGTSFNVSSYATDKHWHTTLVSGKVSLTPSGSSETIVLKPSEQATIDMENKLEVKTVDTEMYSLWKDGIFKFNNMPMEQIAERLQRWYDVSIDLQGSISQEHFTGLFRKNEPIEHILRMMAATKKVVIAGDSKRIIIKPK